MTSTSGFVMAGMLLVAAGIPAVARRPSLLHLLILFMIVVSFSVVFLGASPAVLKAMGRNPTLTDRTDVWKTVLSLVQNPVLGTGFESFWLGPRLEKMWSRYWWHPGQAHNGYLEVYLNLGWIGLTMLGFLLVKGYNDVFRAWRRGEASGSLRLSLFYAGLVFNYTEAAFLRMQAPAWLFFLLAIIGVPASLSVLSKRNTLEPAAPDVWFQPAALDLREPALQETWVQQ